MASKKKKIVIEVEVSTDANEERITQAVEKGLYYGLDVKRVCAPKEVHKIVVRTYNI